MKSRFKLVAKPSASISLKTVFVYSTLCVGLFGVLTWLTFVFLNLGDSENAYAAASYTSNRSGVWTTGSTWNGGTAPSTNLNGDNITISNGHNVSLTGTLSAQNNVTLTIGGVLTIYGDLDVQNNLVLTITGSLIVNGKINVKNGSNIIINGGGNLTASGDLVLGNNADVTVNGTMSIGGSLSFGSNANFNGNGTVSITGAGCNNWTGPGTCNDNTTLPIELISFIAKNTPEGVQLTWKTATELNNDHFTIERSQDGITFSNIGELNGSGTTKVVTEYEYTDSQPLTGSVSYYRLSQTDFDGTIEIFKPIPIEATASSKKQVINVYPNPIVGNTLNVSFSTPEKGTVEFIDSRGYKILSEHVDGFSKDIQLTIDSNIEPGIYYLNFKSGSAKETIKLMKNR